jgi:hypothetical protein
MGAASDSSWPVMTRRPITAKTTKGTQKDFLGLIAPSFLRIGYDSWENSYFTSTAPVRICQVISNESSGNGGSQHRKKDII